MARPRASDTASREGEYITLLDTTATSSADQLDRPPGGVLAAPIRSGRKFRERKDPEAVVRYHTVVGEALGCIGVIKEKITGTVGEVGSHTNVPGSVVVEEAPSHDTIGASPAKEGKALRTSAIEVEHVAVEYLDIETVRYRDTAPRACGLID